jgi:hypothetical protein
MSIEMLSEQECISLLGPDRFARLRARGLVYPVTKNGMYLKSYTQLRLDEDITLEAGARSVITKSNPSPARSKELPPVVSKAWREVFRLFQARYGPFPK